MLHTYDKDKTHNLHQLSPTASPLFSSINHSCLTAALQDADDGHSFPRQLGSRVQLDNLAHCSEGDCDQLQSAIDTDLEGSNWESNQPSIDPSSSWAFASGDEPGFHPRPVSSSSAPWNPYHAFSAPETGFAGSWEHHGDGHKAFQSSIAGACAARSFGGSWSASYLHSPITPLPDTSFGTVNASPLTYDDILATPTDNEHCFLGQPRHAPELNYSRSSSFSKGAQRRSQRNPPISSNQSIEEEEIHDGIEISMEGIDFDETTNTGLGEEIGHTYQPDFANLLSGLQSPLQQTQDYQFHGRSFCRSEEPAEWLLNDTATVRSVEGTTEPFPDLALSDKYHPQGSNNEEIFSNSPSIPRTNDRLQKVLASSPPPSDHPWPTSYEYDNSMDLAREQILAPPSGLTLSTTFPLHGDSQLPTLPIRNRSNRARPPSVSRRSRGNSVNDGKKSVAMTRVSSGLRRGVRDGQLPHAKALEIAQKRENKSVCIACKSARVTCKYNTRDASTCNKCLKLGSICTRANFAEMTDSQTCNPIFQTCCMHLTQDACRRIKISYPHVIDADWLLSQLAIHQTRGNIQIVSVTGAIWEIELRKCYELLSKLPWKGGARRLVLDDLVHNRRMPLTAWLDCMRPGKDDSEFEQFIKYTNMPSHNAYNFLSLSPYERSRQMAADDLKDKQFICMAAQLCRIITRALEIKGFRDLQKELGDFTRLDASDIKATLYRTGRLLGTLRWRLALWELVRKGFPGAAFSDRVKKITHVLYFWFLFVKRRLPEEHQSNLPQGALATYTEVGTIWDDFPQDESPDGFHIWIRGSHKLIEDTYIMSPMASMTPSGLIEEPVLRQDPVMPPSFPEWQMPVAPRKNSYYDPASGLNYEF